MTPAGAAPTYEALLRGVFGARYLDGQDVWSRESALREIGRWALGHVPSPRSRVLDLGVGRAGDAVTFLAAGHAVVGVDLVATPEAQALVEHSQGAFRLEISPVLGLLSDLGQFGLVLDNGCFHHQPPEEFLPYLRAVAGAMSSDGRLVMSVFTPNDPDAGFKVWISPEGRLTRVFPRADLERLLNDAGLRALEWRSFDRGSERAKRYLAVVAVHARADI